MSLNYVKIQGGLTRDPEFRFFDSGSQLVELSVAVNGTRYDSQSRSQIVKTTFISAQAWGWLAEQIMDQGIGKGDEVLIEGELDQTEFENKEGKKERKTRVTILVLNVTRRRAGSQPSPTPTAQPQRSSSQASTNDQGGWGEPPPYDEPPF